MANTYHQMYLHTIFAVKYRASIIEEKWSNELFGVIGNLINELGCKTYIVNGMEDHVHCLVGLRPVVSVSKLMQYAKAKSSKYINDNKLAPEHFEWQDGYGVFSYGQSQIDSVYKYIQHQRQHHLKQSFKNEYVGFLKRFKVDYDEMYVFEELI